MEDSKTLIVFFKTPTSTRRNVLEIHKYYGHASSEGSSALV